MINSQKLLHRVKKPPLSPGVYQFLGKKGKILYIGRATSLRRRVLQYFQKQLEPRIAEMVSSAKNIKVIKTDTVLEAIILEANLIKKYWPKYNVKDKDDRSFIYVVFTKGDYSKPFIVRGRDLSKFPAGSAKIFGPFMNVTLLKNTLRIIRRIFPYSTCKSNSGQACFDYQIGLCPGACIGKISPAEYKKNISGIKKIFSGQKKQLIRQLAKSNPTAAAGLKHISDAVLVSRDELAGASNISRIEAYDISHFAGHEAVGAMAVLTNGQIDKSQYRLFNIHTPAGDDLRALAEVITRRLNHHEWPMPDIFLIDGGRPQINFLKKIFSERHLVKPLVGLSKLGGDILVFSSGTSAAVKDLALSVKPLLLLARDEAHRFGNSTRRRKLRNR
jgi:excinuclease ABC subunit C